MADRTVSTVEEIEALPDRTVVLDSDGDVWQQRGGAWWSSGTQPALSSSITLWAPLTVLVPEQAVADRFAAHPDLGSRVELHVERRPPLTGTVQPDQPADVQRVRVLWDDGLSTVVRCEQLHPEVTA